MPRRLVTIAVALTCLLAASGCGGMRLVKTSAANPSSPRVKSAAAPRPRARRPRPARATPGRPASASELISRAASALGHARSYVLRVALEQNRRTAYMTLTVAGPKSFKVDTAVGAVSWQAIVLPHSGYLRGNAAFWISRMGERGASLADQWLAVPAADVRTSLTRFSSFTGASLAQCLAEDHGTLSIAEHTTIAGHVAVVVRDAGDKPGSTPSLLAIADDGGSYPLRLSSIGDQRPGGAIDRCNNGKGDSSRGVLAFEQFNQVAPLRPPAHVVSVEEALAT